MKKVIFGFVVLSLLFSASCKKSPNAVMSTYSSWTFKGSTYSGDTCQLYNGYFIAWPNSSSSNGYGSYNYVYLNFPNNSLPTTGGVYSVVNYPTFYSSSANNIAVVNFIASNGTYISTGSGSNQKINVSVSSTGKVTVTGTNIMLQESYNGVNQSDSSAITFSMVQTF